MKPKFTPGPWSYNRSDVGFIRVSTFPGNALIADLESPEGFGERQANACLIAAAPELLEALRTLSDCCEASPDFTRKTLPAEVRARRQGAVKNALATIAKAEGCP